MNQATQLQQINPVQIQAQMNALVEQRNNAGNHAVNLAGDLAVANQTIEALQEQIALLTQSATPSAAPAPAPAPTPTQEAVASNTAPLGNTKYIKGPFTCNECGLTIPVGVTSMCTKVTCPAK